LRGSPNQAPLGLRHPNPRPDRGGKVVAHKADPSPCHEHESWSKRFQPGAPSTLQLVQNGGRWLIDDTNLVGSELERRPIVRLLRADPYNRDLDRHCRRLVPAIQPLVATAFHVLGGGAQPIPRNQAKVEFGAVFTLDSQANYEVTPLEQGSEAPGEWRAALDALAAQFSKPPKHPIALSVNQAARIAAAARKLIALAPRAGLPDCRPSVPEIAG
jgi:hypothetical protein